MKDEQRSQLYETLLRHLTGRDKIFPVDLCPPGINGLQYYLDAVYSGRRSHFSVDEIVTPFHPEIAAQVGLTQLVPPKQWWVRTAVHRWIADDIRDLVGVPVSMVYHYRPKPYNDIVSSAKRSAHRWCCATDLQLSSQRYIRKALLEYFDHIWMAPHPINLGLGLGVGPTRIHYDIFSPQWSARLLAGKPGPRHWRYGNMGWDSGPASRWRIDA